MTDLDHLRREAVRALRGDDADDATIDPRGLLARREAERQAERDAAKRDAVNALRRSRGHAPEVTLDTPDLAELVAGGRPLDATTAADLADAYQNRSK